MSNRVIGLYEINVPNAWSIIQANNLYTYCGNNPVYYTDANGNEYTNTIQDNGDGTYTVTTKITVLWTDLEYEYNIENGVVLFDFEENDYWDVLWRGGDEELAQAIFSAAKSISNDYLVGRTAGGINAEFQLHWAAYSVGFMTSNASPANIGGMSESHPGYDSNAWLFQTVQAVKIIGKIKFFGLLGVKDLVNEIGDYLS